MSTNWYSSYEKNNYGDLLYALVRVYKPEKVVELGTKAGYSAYYIARALKENKKGTLDCYDLWEKYVGHYGMDYISKSATQKNLKQFGRIIKFELTDATSVYKKYDTIDILHIDIDNDAKILDKIVPKWLNKVRQMIIIEGGSEERDKAASTTNFKKISVADWLNDLGKQKAGALKNAIPNKTNQYVVVEGEKKYKEKPIAPWLRGLSKRYGNIEYFTIEPFPSVTIIRKK